MHLLADLGADLDQRVAVVRADALRLGQLVANDVARQRRIQWLASALLALVASDRRRFLVIDFDRQCLRGRCERLGLVEEQVLLVGAAGLALGGEQLTLQCAKPLQRQVPLGGHHAQFADQRFATPSGLGQGLLQGCEFFGGGHLDHRLLRSTWCAGVPGSSHFHANSSRRCTP